ncbi:hexosaminidase D-like isoform X2 [Oculina patagonica]
MKIMRLNYTNVGIALSLVAVFYIFFKLSQLSHSSSSVTVQRTGTTTVAIESVVSKDTRAALFEAELQKAKDTILSLKRELAEAKSVPLKENRMDRKRLNGHKLVHLDLKGAPTKMDYLIEMLPHFKRWGATGLLVEYEDMFPYNGKYEVLRAKNSYSEAEIKHFLEVSTANDLIVMPLVQTFGHLEFVLKHKEFAHLRETEHFTNSLCPNNKASMPMVFGLIDQVLTLHRGVKWFHIGGDEVWNLKTCQVCQKDARNKSELFVHHMSPILKHLQSRKITPVMWDDMMRHWPVEYLKVLGPLVEPMVWAYRSDLTGYFPPDMWQRYGEAFNKIWAASAFKGATHPWSNFVPVGFHVQNNLNWLDIIAKLPSSLEVNGIALTGWSRYDHYATLCELLPAALPSLAYCLQALGEGYLDEERIKSTAKLLGLPETFPLNVGRFSFSYQPPNGTFPGHDIFTLVGHLEKAVYDTRGVGNIEQGWLLEREVENKFLSYYQVESAYNKTVHGLQILTSLKSEADKVLGLVYDDSVVKEWVKDKLDDGIKRLSGMKPQLEELKKIAAGKEGKQE